MKIKNTFIKGYTQNWSEKVFAIRKVKYNFVWAHVTEDLNGAEIVGTFYEKKLQN